MAYLDFLWWPGGVDLEIQFNILQHLQTPTTRTRINLDNYLTGNQHAGRNFVEPWFHCPSFPVPEHYSRALIREKELQGVVPPLPAARIVDGAAPIQPISWTLMNDSSMNPQVFHIIWSRFAIPCAETLGPQSCLAKLPSR